MKRGSKTARQTSKLSDFDMEAAHLVKPLIPDPQNHGWIKSDGGVLSVEWCKDLVPQQLAEILSGSDTEQGDNNETYLQCSETTDEEDDISESDSSEEELID